MKKKPFRIIETEDAVYKRIDLRWMKPIAWTVSIWLMVAGSIFIKGKLRNDGNIARDTTRVAEAMERLVRR